MSLVQLLPLESESPEETIALGRRLAPCLHAGDVLALYGDLGAGKTHLVKGIAAGLGFPPEDVTSPTFTLVQEYPTDPPVYHIDVYRIEDHGELERMGMDEYLNGNGICVVEWPERMGTMLPDGCIRIRLSHAGGGRRRIELMAGAF